MSCQKGDLLFTRQELPLLAPKRVVEGHKWHLAIEFGNWIEAAAAGGFDF